jgi:hypothetical protein
MTKKQYHYKREIFATAHRTINHEITAEEQEEEINNINLRYLKGMPLFKKKDGGKK